MPFDPLAALEACREAEKEQALFYRALATLAEDAGEAALAERFQELHADEQHHLSRLTARLVELGHLPVDLAGTHAPRAALAGWEELARRREEDEARRYLRLLDQPFDPPTRALLQATLEVERHHAEQLGGKWTLA